MSIYERVVNDCKDWSMRKLLKQAAIYDGTAAAKFYFCDNPREFWDIAVDFPNLKPPNDNFFVNITTPDKLVSWESGINSVPVINYGVWFRVKDISQGLTTEQKAAAIKNAKHMEADLLSHARTLIKQKLLESGGDHNKMFTLFSKDEKSLLRTAYAVRNLTIDVFDSKPLGQWKLECALFYPYKGKIKKVHSMVLIIESDGSVVHEKEVVYAGGPSKDFINPGMPFQEIAKLSRQMEIFYHPALLVISSINGYKLAL